ncbi:MAG: inositol monophosphatase [Chloroflexota bacterium]
MLPDKEILHTIEQAAYTFVERANQMVYDQYGSSVEVTFKDIHGADPVTELDRTIEQLLVTTVAEQFPDHAVLGEESSDVAQMPEWLWVIDPIDGTRNFTNHIPLFAVSVGVLHYGRPVVGVIGLPAADTILHAHAGGGAYHNQDHLPTLTSTELHPGLLGVQDRDFWRDWGADLELQGYLGESRWLGSTAYEFAMITTGTFHFGLFAQIALWDVAAGITLVQEAGGQVLYYDHQQAVWKPFERFTVEAPLREWAVPLIVGTVPTLATLAACLRPGTKASEH